jgi:hypothetical protein
MQTVGAPLDILHEPIDFTQLAIGDAKASAGSPCKWARVLYDGKSVTVQTPRMALPFEFGRDNTNVCGSVPSDTAYARAFADAIERVDEHVVAVALANPAALFGKDVPADRVRSMHMPSLNKKSAAKYLPTFRMKVRKDKATGAALLDVFDHERARVEVPLDECFKRGASVTAIVELTGVWVNAGKFGCIWALRQVHLEQPAKTNGYLFNDSVLD